MKSQKKKTGFQHATESQQTFPQWKKSKDPRLFQPCSCWSFSNAAKLPSPHRRRATFPGCGGQSSGLDTGSMAASEVWRRSSPLASPARTADVFVLRRWNGRSNHACPPKIRCIPHPPLSHDKSAQTLPKHSNSFCTSSQNLHAIQEILPAGCGWVRRS